MSNERPETGPMQFGDDWSGVFIRGDDCFAYAMYLRTLLDSMDDNFVIEKMNIESLLQILSSSMGNPKSGQKLQDFNRCLPIVVQLLK